MQDHSVNNPGFVCSLRCSITVDQIFAYAKNKTPKLERARIQYEVSDMLLCARTNEDVQPDGLYRMSGNKISVRTLDLGLPFEEIRARQDAVVEDHFGRDQERPYRHARC